MASRVSAAAIPVVDLTAADTPAALRSRSRSRAIASATTPSFSSSPAVPKRRAPESPILVEDDTPPPAKRRPSETPGSVVPETPQWYGPCSSPRSRSRAATPDTPDSVLRSSFRSDFESPDLEIPGSVDPDILVLQTPRPTGPSPSSVQFVPETPQSFVPCSLDPPSRGADATDSGIPRLAFPGSTDPDIVVLETPGLTPPRPSGAPVVAETPQSFVPCSLDTQSRGAVPDMPCSVLPRSFETDFDAAAAADDSGIPGPAFPGSADPNIVVAETPLITSSHFDVAEPSTLPGLSSTAPARPSSPISVDSDDELDDFGYKEPLDKLILPCEDLTLQEEEDNNNNAESLQEEEENNNNAESLQEEENNNNAEERMTKQERRQLIKEGKAKLIEEKKRQREENKLMKEASKAQKAVQKKYAKEKEDWESGKHALKSIVAEIDSTIIESGSVGGTLLTRFEEKGLRYRVQANRIRGSILWKMEVPQIGQDPASVSEVPYILFVLQAEEFCDLISSGSFFDHVHEVQSCYPTFTICYVTNKLMHYITKRERAQYKNPSSSNSWNRPPVEEVFCKLVTHHVRVHSRQCIDEAEVAEHVVGLTSSLANCKFRKPLSWLSVHANGAVIPKNFIDKDLAKKDTWIKALIAIPKVQPRFALAIWKKYATMRSLLNVYMDPTKTDREKELLLQDLKCEDRIGEESRRVGPVCSKRVYKTLMAQDGGAEADAAE